MTKDELKNKYSAFITEISEILGLGKPIDVLKLCATTELFFQPLEKHIETLEKENAELKSIAVFQTSINMERHFKLKRNKEQLTKAKEIIKKFSEFVNIEVAYVHEHPQEITDKWNELCKQTKQFLNSEVEK